MAVASLNKMPPTFNVVKLNKYCEASVNSKNKETQYTLIDYFSLFEIRMTTNKLNKVPMRSGQQRTLDGWIKRRFKVHPLKNSSEMRQHRFQETAT